jgi:hypothetical protein
MGVVRGYEDGRSIPFLGAVTAEDKRKEDLYVWFVWDMGGAFLHPA